ncbi:MAG TPA: crosslink repair DNA glycosylase YcaQ family protein [Candidatus Limnocylindria bacterium]
MPTSASTAHLSADHARRFLVRRQLLDPPRSLPAKPESVLRVVERLGSVQFDPLEVPGARSQDMVLHARIKDFRREWTDGWLYAPLGERRLIELYNKSLNILPIEELPLHRAAWEQWRDGLETGVLRDHAELVATIVERVERDGQLSTDAFRDIEHRVEWWWDSDGTTTTRAAKAVMEALFVIGRLGIARREGSRRYYDLIERLVPADLLAQSADPADQHRHRLLSRHRGVGLMAVGGPGELVAGTGKAADRASMTAKLVEDGTLIPVQVEGFREVRHVLAAEWPLLEATASPDPRTRPAVAFVAPLDPLMWDRRLVRGMFGFEYLWEVYVPAAKRRWGYYVLPILFGDRLVGRIEPRYERATRTLRIAGVWFEDGFSPMEEPHFVPALAEGLSAYRSFVGARTITWPRTRPGRDLAGAVRPLLD